MRYLNRLLSLVILIFLIGISNTVKAQSRQLIYRSDTFSLNSELGQLSTPNFSVMDYTRTEKIPFGDTISFDLDEHAEWRLIDLQSGDVIINGEGSIENLVFSSPGKFLIDIPSHNSSISDGCLHNFSPEKILVEVSSYKLSFDFNSIQFSREIIGGANLDGTTVTISATFESFYGEQKIYEGTIASSGVGANISGFLATNSTELQIGKNRLEFQLTGQAKSGTYIMLDFYDVNDIIQCYYFKSPLK